MILAKRLLVVHTNIMSGEEEYTRRQAGQCKVQSSIFLNHVIVSMSQNLKYSSPLNCLPHHCPVEENSKSSVSKLDILFFHVIVSMSQNLKYSSPLNCLPHHCPVEENSKSSVSKLDILFFPSHMYTDLIQLTQTLLT